MDGNTQNGGKGLVVCFGTVITFIAGIGHVNSFGLIYNDFMVSTHATAKSLTSAHGVFAIMLAVGGTLLNVMLKKLSLKSGGLLGAALFSIGSFSTIFITNVNLLIITFGVLQGIGFGMMVPVCYSTINYYFVEKRTTVMSVIKSIQGMILIGYPYLMKTLVSQYGFRGTLLVLSAISLHVFAGMIVMGTHELKPMKEYRTANNIETIEGQVEDRLLKGNNNETLEKKSDKTKIKTSDKVISFMNLDVIKDPVYVNICLGQSFVNFSDLTFFVLQPMLLFQYGYSRGQIATCISIGAGADVAGRFLLAAISCAAPINTRLLYYVATIFTLVFRIVMLQVHGYLWMWVVTGLLGVLRGWLHVASPLVVSNYVKHEHFPAAYALYLLTAGVINVTFAPLIGLLKDVYQDYVPAFYALSLCCAPCLLFWPVEYTMKNK